MSINLKHHSQRLLIFDTFKSYDLKSLECCSNFVVLDFTSSKKPNKPYTIISGTHQVFLIFLHPIYLIKIILNLKTHYPICSSVNESALALSIRALFKNFLLKIFIRTERLILLQQLHVFLLLLLLLSLIRR